MKVADLFPTRFIAAGDLNGKSFTLTIRSVTLEDMQSHENKTVTKPVAWFTNAAKGLVLNRTNTMIIAALHGPETEHWAGKQIIIYATKVRAFGKMEDAIRVREEIPAGSPLGPRPVAQAAQVEEQSGLDDDEDVPRGLPDFDGSDSLDITSSASDSGHRGRQSEETYDPDTGEIRGVDESLWEPDAPVSSKPNRLSPAQMTRLHVLGNKLHPGKGEWDAQRPRYIETVSKGSISSAKELTPNEADTLIAEMERKLAKQAGELQSTGESVANGKVREPSGR